MKRVHTYSFDIFDTLLTRTTATPQGIFAIMQHILQREKLYGYINKSFRENFAIIREHAEELARYSIQRNGVEDITLDEIYEYIDMRHELSADELDLIKELELSTELEHSIGIEENIRKIKQYLENNDRVIIISDMYLPKAIVKEMLVKADPIFETIKIYISNEYRKIKFSGNLYRVVSEREEIDVSDWTHRGDNPRGDVAGAEKVGIKTDWYRYPELNEAEKLLLDKGKRDPVRQLIVGASRNARLKKSMPFSYIMGTSIGGAILTSYVEWVIKQCDVNKIDRLYFIARDGYILKKIADYILEKENKEIATYYIYGSRKAWRMASYDDQCSLRELLEWSHYNRINSIEKLAEVLQVEPEEIRPFLTASLRNVNVLDTVTKRQVIDCLDCKEFSGFLTEKHKERRRLTTQYIRDSVIFTDDRFAFVELGGSGYTQECLSNMISTFYTEPIRTFYFKMDMLRKSKHCDFFTFYPSKLKQHILIEVLCHAPHGQTSGYRENKGKIDPILETYEDEALKQHGIEDYISGIISFVEARYLINHVADEYEIPLEIVDELYELLSSTDDPEILSFIGDMPNSVTGRENVPVGYAPKLSNMQIRRIFLGKRRNKEEYYKGTSLEYSVRRCNTKQQKRIQWYKDHYYGLIGRNYRRIIGEEKDDSNIFIPLELLNKKVVIYAAGERGQLVYKRFVRSAHRRNVLWVDNNWQAKRAEGLRVDPVNMINDFEYDYVIITIENPIVVEEVKQSLARLDVDPSRIISV